MRKRTKLLLNIIRFIFLGALGAVLFIAFLTLSVAWLAIG